MGLWVPERAVVAVSGPRTEVDAIGLVLSIWLVHVVTFLICRVARVLTGEKGLPYLLARTQITLTPMRDPK